MLNRSPRVFSTEFKERAVLRLRAGEGYSLLAAELGVRRKLLYEWSRAYARDGVAGLNRKRGPKPGAPSERQPRGDPLAHARTRIAELERLVGQQQADLDFFREALRLTGGDMQSFDWLRMNGHVPGKRPVQPENALTLASDTR